MKKKVTLYTPKEIQCRNCERWKLCLDNLGTEYAVEEPNDKIISRAMITHCISYPLVLVEEGRKSRLLHGECPEIGKAVTVIDMWQLDEMSWKESVGNWKELQAL